jgi:hypothetical protein
LVAYGPISILPGKDIGTLGATFYDTQKMAPLSLLTVKEIAQPGRSETSAPHKTAKPEHLREIESHKYGIVRWASE